MVNIETKITITGQASEEDFQEIFDLNDFYRNDYLSYEIDGLDFKIQTAPYNPLEYDDRIKFLNFLGNYNIGVDSLENKDGEEISHEDIDDIESFLDKNDYFYVRVRGYSHGGLSLSIESRANAQHYDAWDSGTAGYLAIKKSDLRDLREVKKLTPKILKEEEEFFSSLVKELENYLEGNQYEAIIQGDGIYESQSIEYPEDAFKFFADFYNQNKAA